MDHQQTRRCSALCQAPTSRTCPATCQGERCQGERRHCDAAYPVSAVENLADVQCASTVCAAARAARLGWNLDAQMVLRTLDKHALRYPSSWPTRKATWQLQQQVAQSRGRHRIAPLTLRTP